MSDERIHIQVTEYSCAYCGQPVDPAHPEDHIATCPQHPMARYKRALEGLVQQIEEVCEGPEVGENTRDKLLKAIAEAVQTSGQEEQK